jgi:hypothetical protein
VLLMILSMTAKRRVNSYPRTRISGFFNFAYIDEESGMAIFFGIDNGLDADWDNGVFKDNFRGVWGSIDGRRVE